MCNALTPCYEFFNAGTKQRAATKKGSPSVEFVWKTHDFQTRCKTLSLDPLTCKNYCNDVVAPRPCTGGLKVDFNPKLHHSLPRLRACLLYKPSWFVSCSTVVRIILHPMCSFIAMCRNL